MIWLNHHKLRVIAKNSLNTLGFRHRPTALTCRGHSNIPSPRVEFSIPQGIALQRQHHPTIFCRSGYERHLRSYRSKNFTINLNSLALARSYSSSTRHRPSPKRSHHGLHPRSAAFAVIAARQRPHDANPATVIGESQLLLRQLTIRLHHHIGSCSPNPMLWVPVVQAVTRQY